MWCFLDWTESPDDLPGDGRSVHLYRFTCAELRLQEEKDSLLANVTTWLVLGRHPT